MKRLGLSIGAGSIGWCLIEGDARIVDLGVRIFSDGRDSRSGASLAVGRRVARAMRRRRDRYIGRRKAFLIALKRNGLMPVDAASAKLLADRDPYELRVRALVGRLEPFEIGRALFHLNQRRGFKPNRQTGLGTEDAETGKIAAGSLALDREMAEHGFETLGQFLHDRLNHGEHARVRMSAESQRYDFYPERRHILYEFGRIWEEQARHHPGLLTEEARDALYRVLEFQRPWKKHLIGRCVFLEEDRLAKAHPLFQEHRLYEDVNRLEITTSGSPARKLTTKERDKLILRLRGVKAAGFASLAKLLKLGPGQSFDRASATRTKFAGDEVHATLADKRRFGIAWASFSVERQWEIIQRLLDEEDPETLHASLTGECGLGEEAARATARASLPEGRARLGPTATRLILDEHKAAVLTYKEAVQKVAMKDPRFCRSRDFTGEPLGNLPYYGELLSHEIPPGTQDPADPMEVRWGKIANPTVHIALRQLGKLVNAVIAVHGRPNEIVVELARELKQSKKQMDEENRRSRHDVAAMRDRSRKLDEIGIDDTYANNILVQAWEDLNPYSPLDRRCVYCGEIIEADQIRRGMAGIDHIIPYSRSLDDSASNKVVAHRRCSRLKGDCTPYEKWGVDEKRWSLITAQVARLHESKRWRFGPDAMAQVEGEVGLFARQLTDTQFLSRLVGRYLSCLYSKEREAGVRVIPGRMTATLRRSWNLNNLLPDHGIIEDRHDDAPINRLDHRHHAIDAAVVAATTLGLMQQIVRAAGQAEHRDPDRLLEDLPQPWLGFREDLLETLQRVTVSHKADHGRKGIPAKGRDSTAGRLHNETAYGLTGDLAPDGKRPIVVHRLPFAALTPADIENDARIADSALRVALQQATGGLDGKDFKVALARFAREHSQFKGVRRVRVREPLNVIAIRDKDGRAYKAYKGDANLRYDVWRLPDGQWMHDIVSMFDAHQHDRQERRPHPAAKKMLSLRQSDMLAIERSNAPPEYVRVVKFSTNGVIALAAAHEAGPLKARHADSGDPFKYIYSSGTGLKKLKARQVRIDPLGRVFDPGSRT